MAGSNVLQSFELQQPGRYSLDDLAAAYDKNGFCLLSGVDESVTNLFETTLSYVIGESVEAWLNENSSAVFAPQVRQQLSRVESSGEIKKLTLERFRSVLLKLIGPLSHVSSTFHSQFKHESAKAVDHGGYQSEMEYMEVHGPYLLHQDFAGASFPTTPSMLILWIPLNTSPHWNLRLYRGSHKLGLLCNTWMQLDHAKLSAVGEPIDIQAKKGTAVLFNAMTLHGTSNPGPQRRVSCDIRFFPLCGFLPSEVYLLHERPILKISEDLKQNLPETVRTPLLEDLVYLSSHINSRSFPLFDAHHFSVLNWVNYLSLKTAGKMVEAADALRRMVNVEHGIDPAEVYVEKFHPHEIRSDTIRKVAGQIEATSPNWHNELTQVIDSLCAR
jgi:ectoine hydroxylase-related dioxygenase (phytanoyl-CoA dioxygenase family)